MSEEKTITTKIDQSIDILKADIEYNIKEIERLEKLKSYQYDLLHKLECIKKSEHFI